jgi:hypothetical protein
MKKISLFLAPMLVLTALQSQAFLNCKVGDRATTTMAAEMYTHTVKLFEQGFINKIEVTRANIFQLEAKLCSGAISQNDFCTVAMPLLVEVNVEIFRVSPQERRERISLLAEGKAICGL